MIAIKTVSVDWLSVRLICSGSNSKFLTQTGHPLPEMVAPPSRAQDRHLQGIVLTSPACVEVACCISHCTLCLSGYLSSSLSSSGAEGIPLPTLLQGPQVLLPAVAAATPSAAGGQKLENWNRPPLDLLLDPLLKHRFVSQTSLRKGKESSSLPAPTPHPSSDLSRFY